MHDAGTSDKARIAAVIRRLTVITGDHASPDPTKLDACWGPEDAAAHRAMIAALEGLERFELTVEADHRGLFDRLAADPPELAVNFCDTGVFNQPGRELNLPAWLELHGIPYTGATPQAIALCFDKQVVRLVAESLGVEVPREAFMPAADGFEQLPAFYPALLKPNKADGSVGITMDAVVREEAEARAYLRFLTGARPGCDVLWQEYLPGPEYGMGLIGNPTRELVALPPLEVDFSALPEGANPILSFESKTDPSSPYWTDIRFRRADLPTGTAAKLEGWARLLFDRFGLQDYARFDFRTAADGRPKLMEINPNPAWATDGKLAFMAGFAGIAYPRMLEMVIDAAALRAEGA